MSFYKELSKYYDLVFPVSNETVGFISSIAGNQPCSILDVACGTGGYSIELDKLGYHVTAVDLSAEMIEELKEKVISAGYNIRFQTSDMLKLDENLDKNSFNLAFCIGNSVVHLENSHQIGEFFKAVRQILTANGSFVFQVINFDRILMKDVKSLPTLKNDEIGLSFERFYRYENDQNKVFFKSILTVDGQRFENEIPLYPLLFDETKELLNNAGFHDLKFYGDFTGNAFVKDESYMMVVHAK